MKIGIIGYGYVGSAVAHSYPNDKIIVHDPKYPEVSVDVETIKKKSQAIFVCVPTPSNDQGQCNVDILKSVIQQLDGYTGVVICKSTAPPRVYQDLEKNSNLKLAHVPEFLTQARAKFDYLNPHKIVIGCKKKIRDEVTEIVMESAVNFDRVKIEYCNIAEASFFKYMANNMLAIKVVVNNEFKEMADALDLDWDRISTIAKTDYRLGGTHWSVPGPDNRLGYGGACFPKDTAAFRYQAQELGIETAVLSATIQRNQQYRKND